MHETGDKKRERHQVNENSDPVLKPASDEEVNVGLALRALRAKHNLSIRALAEQSGLAVNTLSLIENGKTSPSVSTLQQLAGALAVPITAFFQSGGPKNSIAYVRAGRRRSATFAHVTPEDLGIGLEERTIEPFIITIRPATGSGPQPIVHTGQEFVFCLDGRIVYTIQEETFLLEPGDSLLFEAHLPHRWQNIEAFPARAILVLCQAEGREQPTARHFVPD